MLEVDQFTSISTKIFALQNMLNTQFNNMKLGVTQSVTIVNTIQQTSSWHEIYGNSDHFVAMCSVNLEYVGNAQRLNHGNAYNKK